MMPESFHPAVSAWFESEFPAATDVQCRAWRAIGSRTDTLISAPTGSGKTLAAFLGVIDALVKAAAAGRLVERTSVLYVSPLKALSNDVQKNLQLPLAGIRRELAASGLEDAPIRAWVRTGDTPQSERVRMRRRPPHILVTTPESLYILLTSDSGRSTLETVETVIVDEIHALAGSKRGAHLALSLERLTELCHRPPLRVGLSATAKPTELIAEFLVGNRSTPRTIIDTGHARPRDLALELPPSPLEAIMSAEVWGEVYDRLAELVRGHRTTLIFVNTRRLAERVARHLTERLGAEHVTSHHGSLAREHRLDAEQRLKAGRLKALVATASLELGIDIGDVDLVIQLGSPRSIMTFLQRIGRSGHGPERLPRGRLMPLSRDELVECAALLESVGDGRLEAIELPEGPLDVLAQQIVAEVGIGEWEADRLFELCRRATCYRTLRRESYMAVVDMLAQGFSTQRGRRSAYLHFDRVNGILRGRRGARLTAITNGGAIPDQFDYDVLLLPAEQPVGTLNEDFAFESLPGDIFQLGNTSYRILKVNSGKVLVEDAKGQPPNIPFWIGEAPGRSDELSAAVGRLRERIEAALAKPGATPAAISGQLEAALGLPAAAASQLVDYLAAARAALGALPTCRRIIFERFFDETGDSHLVIHSPLGSRLNRAWGLALRKRFCRRFNFELQAAASEDAIVLSLGAVHSFPLEEVVGYLHSRTVKDVLSQALLGAPMFPGRWRWNATIALAVRRFRNGRRAPAQFQRMDAEDLMAVIFPDQLACAENLRGEREIPEHPLIEQTMADCLHEVTDAEHLVRLLEGIEGGRVEVSCRDLTSPSPLAQEILGARPYAFLDDAPAEERRTLAVQARRYLSVEQAAELGRLDSDAIRRVVDEAWPPMRDSEELADGLNLLGFATEQEVERRWPGGAALAFDRLREQGRATRFRVPGREQPLWVAVERLPELALVLPAGAPAEAPPPSTMATPETALRELLRSRLECVGPVDAAGLAAPLGLPAADVLPALLALEQEGFLMRGSYTEADAEQWCERRLLARIHRYTLGRLRSEIEPVTIADYQRFLFRWQGVGMHRREGPEALAAVVEEMQGLALPALAWEREMLPARLRAYGPEQLDALSSTGAVVWWRPRGADAAVAHRASTLATSPIAILPRAEAEHWRRLSGTAEAPQAELSGAAQRVHATLAERGALFFVELVNGTGLLRVQVEQGLAELAALGLATADSFAGLRALLTPPSKRRGFGRRGRRGPSLDAGGRWTLLAPLPAGDSSAARLSAEHAARALLERYGVVCRAVLARESMIPPWRVLLECYRRWEARGEIRGGRFVAALGGEQFALNDAVAALRRARRERDAREWVVLSAADPLHLPLLLGAPVRVPALASRRVLYCDGSPVATVNGAGRVAWIVPADASQQREGLAALAREPRSAGPSARRAGRLRALHLTG